MGTHSDIQKVKRHNSNKTNKKDSNREILRPHKNKRLRFEAVFIGIIKPSRKNGNNYGLIFASVFAPNEKIELDHVVIKMDPNEFENSNLILYNRYQFTARVETYYKTGYILGTLANSEHFMLQSINMNKIKQINGTHLKQPTSYVKNRINTISKCKIKELVYTEDELLDIIMNMANDGSVERFINKYSETYQGKKMNKNDIVDILYA